MERPLRVIRAYRERTAVVAQLRVSVPDAECEGATQIVLSHKNRRRLSEALLLGFGHGREGFPLLSDLISLRLEDPREEIANLIGQPSEHQLGVVNRRRIERHQTDSSYRQRAFVQTSPGPSRRRTRFCGIP